MKEIIKLGEKSIYCVYGCDKAYDRAWGDAIIYVMHKDGLKSKLWQTIKSLSDSNKEAIWYAKKNKKKKKKTKKKEKEKKTARVNTKHGFTRKINIKDSIRQGGVLLVLEYELLMDEISKR